MLHLPFCKTERTDYGARTVFHRVLHDSPSSLQTALDFREFNGASLELW